MSSISVAEEGHRRKRQMNEEEFLQCLQDIESWFQRNGGENLSLYHPPSRGDIESLSKRAGSSLPRSLVWLLTRCEKKIYLLDKEMLEVDEIHKVMDELEESKNWEEGFVPFARDMQDRYFGVNSEDRLVEIDADGEMTDYASSFLDFMEMYRNNMLSSSLEYMEDLGVMEIVTK